MLKDKKDFSLFSHGLKYRLKISFSLMSLLPTLVCIYLVSNYILPYIGFKLDITLSVIISIFITLIGFSLVREVFNRILTVATDAKLIAAGDISHRIDYIMGDEIGDLGEALNELTQRIRKNMDELNSYGEKVNEVNLDIQKRVIMLSNLLQISSLISQGAKLQDILDVSTEKSRLLANSDTAYLLFKKDGKDKFFMKAVNGIDSRYLLKITIEPEESIFNKINQTNKPFIIDKENVLPENLSNDFYEKFKLKNTLALPIYLRGKVVGLLGIGNNKEGFFYKRDDIELLDIFAKQIAIAVENDALIHQIEKLQVRDALTGLYNEAFISNCLQEEIKRAIIHHRPCAFIVINIDNFKKFHQNFGSLQAESMLKRISVLIKDSVSEIDYIARIGDNEFAIVLPERNKRQAQHIAEDIRKKIESIFNQEEDINKRVTVSGAVSENPIDGVEAEKLITKAKELLKVAKLQGKNRIVTFLKEELTCQ